MSPSADLQPSERAPGLREGIGGHPNVTVTEGRNGDGVYEAVFSTLAERR